MPGIKWSEKELELLIKSYPNIKTEDLAKILGKSSRAIITKAKRLKISKNNDALRTYRPNDLFFSSKNIYSSYVAGLFAADAYLPNNTSRIVLKLAAKDEIYLKNIAKLVEWNGPLIHTIYDRHDNFTLTINSSQWRKDLDCNFLLNYHNKVNRNLKIPDLEHREKLAFITGLIDGDGFVGLIKNKVPEIQVCGNIEIIQEISDLAKILIGTTGKNFSKTKHEKLFSFKLTHNMALKFASEILSISELDNIRMNRKWSKIISRCQSIYLPQ